MSQGKKRFDVVINFTDKDLPPIEVDPVNVELREVGVWVSRQTYQGGMRVLYPWAAVHSVLFPTVEGTA
jgi:hypothetical protein